MSQQCALDTYEIIVRSLTLMDASSALAVPLRLGSTAENLSVVAVHRTITFIDRRNALEVLILHDKFCHFYPE